MTESDIREMATRALDEAKSKGLSSSYFWNQYYTGVCDPRNYNGLSERSYNQLKSLVLNNGN